jgi:hypothetical protein
VWRATPESEHALREALEGVRGRIAAASDYGPVYAQQAYAGVVEQIFATEGSFIHEPWAPLAPRTVAERQAHYGLGAHPILRREGNLLRSLTDVSFGPRSVAVLTDEGLEHHQTGSAVELKRQGGDVWYRFGTLDDRFHDLYLGRSDMPARHMVPGAEHADLLGEPLDSALVRIIENA